MEKACAERAARARAKGGAVTVVQRTSSDLRLDPHPHVVVLDGAYLEDKGELAWNPQLGRARSWTGRFMPNIKHQINREELVIATRFAKDER